MSRALGSASCDITDETLGTICYGHWVLRLVIKHTRDRKYGLLRASGSASSDITHETGGTICYGHWDLCFVISQTRQGVRFVTGIGFRGRSASCDITHETRGYDLLRELGSVSFDITHATGGTTCFGIGYCVLSCHTRDRGYELLWALGSVSCNITDETGGTICYGHLVLWQICVL